MRRNSVAVRAAVITLFALIGWAACGATMAVGPLFFTMQTTLVLHAIVATLAFAVLSAVYFMRFAFTGPTLTASLFLAIVVGLDVLLVAPVFVGDFGMFASPLGTWIPFLLIFAVTLSVGRVVTRGAPGV